MTNVIVVDSKNRISKEIFMLLSRCSGAFYSGNNENISIGNDVDFIVTDNKNIEKICVKNSVVVLGEVGKHFNEKALNGVHSVIVSAENERALALLKGKITNVFVCGMSVRDTVTLTSNTGECATVCIKRTFESLNGEENDECEIPIETEGYDDFSVMCAGVVLLIS